MHSKPRVAYFSMEIALEPDVPTYSGGLGVLAGDTMRSAADLGVPLVGVTLASRAGYFRQRIDGGRQREEPQTWDPGRVATRVPVKVAVPIAGREVWVAAWEYRVPPSPPGAGEPVHVLLLDTDLPENDREARRITQHLYGGDTAYRLRQELVLGIGGVRMLQALGVQVDKFHLNEGHAAFLTLQLLRALLDRGRCRTRSAPCRRSASSPRTPRCRPDTTSSNTGWSKNRCASSSRPRCCGNSGAPSA
jgi:glycogen phosphorylase